MRAVGTLPPRAQGWDVDLHDALWRQLRAREAYTGYLVRFRLDLLMAIEEVRHHTACWQGGIAILEKVCPLHKLCVSRSWRHD